MIARRERAREMEIDPNHARAQLINVAVRYCVGKPNLDGYRKWMNRTIKKEDSVPWSEIIGSFETQDRDTNSKVIYRLHLGDFVVLFEWIFTSDHPVAALILQRLRTTHL